MLDKELIKEIIIMFLQNEKDIYEAITEMAIKKEVKDIAKEDISLIDSLIKHSQTNYDNILEAICEELNKKKEAKKQKIDKK